MSDASPAGPAGIVLRGLEPTDVAAWARLLAAAEAVDGHGEHYSEEDLAEEYADPAITPTKDIVGAWDGEQLVGVFQLTPRRDGSDTLRLYVGGTVHPQRREEGIGSILVAAMVVRAAEHADEQGALRADLMGSVTDRVPDALALLRDHGFEGYRFSFDMQVPLEGREPRERSHDRCTLRRFAEDDGALLMAAHNIAFADYPGFVPWDEESWHQHVLGSHTFRPQHTWLALADGEIAAYLQAAEFTAHEEATGVRQGYVAKVGTLPHHRGQGLAALLLETVLDDFAAAGYATAGLDVDTENPTGALGIYERAGFTVKVAWTQLRRFVPAAAATPGPAGED